MGNLTPQQKHRIIDLRKEGLSYRQIADAVQIPLSTAKTVCRRHRLQQESVVDTPPPQAPRRKRSRQSPEVEVTISFVGSDRVYTSEEFDALWKRYVQKHQTVDATQVPELQ